MLVLTREPGQTLRLGDEVTLTILEVRGGRVRVGINAPQTIRVLRAERAENSARPVGVPLEIDSFLELLTDTGLELHEPAIAQ